MTEHERLDEAMRGRLARLSEAAPRLDAAARERAIAGAIAAHRAAQRRRNLAIAGAGALALAAAALIALWPATPEAPRCASWAPVDGEALERVSSLGARGWVGLSEGGAAHLSVREACTTEITLDAGSVGVRADDLGGGELLVRAGDVTVRVTGTRFGVSREDGRVEVAVTEGAVEVRTPAGTTRLGAGHALTLGEGERAIAAVWRERIEHLLGGEPSEPASGAEAGADELATEAGVEPATEAEAEAGAEPTEAGAEPATEAGAGVEAGEPEGAAPFDPEAAALSAEASWRRGDREDARALFRRAATQSEAACLRWARLELEAGALDHADAALAIHRRRHARGRMGAEAAYLGLELLEARGDEAGVREAARAIIERYPSTPQARAAARRLP